MDLKDRKFGYLTVVGNSEQKGYVTCKCRCGNVVDIRATSLTKTKHPTRSCGCIQKKIAAETGRNNIKSNSQKQIQTNMLYHTNFQVIENSKAPLNNTSGCKGVSWNNQKNKWHAYISLHGKRVNLGYFKNKDDAVKARKEGEEKYYQPLIEQKQQAT